MPTPSIGSVGITETEPTDILDLFRMDIETLFDLSMEELFRLGRESILGVGQAAISSNAQTGTIAIAERNGSGSVEISE